MRAPTGYMYESPPNLNMGYQQQQQQPEIDVYGTPTVAEYPTERQ